MGGTVADARASSPRPTESKRRPVGKARVVAIPMFEACNVYAKEARAGILRTTGNRIGIKSDSNSVQSGFNGIEFDPSEGRKRESGKAQTSAVSIFETLKERANVVRISMLNPDML